MLYYPPTLVQPPCPKIRTHTRETFSLPTLSTTPSLSLSVPLCTCVCACISSVRVRLALENPRTHHPQNAHTAQHTNPLTRIVRVRIPRYVCVCACVCVRTCVCTSACVLCASVCVRASENTTTTATLVPCAVSRRLASRECSAVCTHSTHVWLSGRCRPCPCAAAARPRRTSQRLRCRQASNSSSCSSVDRHKTCARVAQHVRSTHTRTFVCPCARGCRRQRRSG